MLDPQPIREALGALPTDVSSSIAEPPKPAEIYAPPGHAQALDPERSVVVGARGMGKSFWAAAYTDDSARHSAAELYPTLGLDELLVSVGFSGELVETSPSPSVLKVLLREGFGPEDIWRGVVLHGINTAVNKVPKGSTWVERIGQVKDVEAVEQAFLRASRQLQSDGKRLVFVFDALDKLAQTWPEIRELTRGLLRTALEFRTLRGIRFKIFLRLDQYEDLSVFNFPTLRSFERRQ